MTNDAEARKTQVPKAQNLGTIFITSFISEDAYEPNYGISHINALGSPEVRESQDIVQNVNVLLDQSRFLELV